MPLVAPCELHLAKGVRSPAQHRKKSMALTVHQIAEYETNGFLLLPGLLDPPAVDKAVAAVEALAADPATLGKIDASNPRLDFDVSTHGGFIGEQVLKMVEPVLDLSPHLSELIESEAIQSIFRSIFDGEDPVLFEDKVHFKLPTFRQQGAPGEPQGAGVGVDERAFSDAGAFPWHQDFAFWSQYSSRLATLVIYLDDATELNGALQLRKNPIASGPLPHVRANARFPLKLDQGGDGDTDGDGAGAGGSAGLRNNGATTTSAGRRGSAVLFSCMTPHASLPNISLGARRTLFVTYNPSSHGDGYNVVSTTPALYTVGSHNLGQLSCHKIAKWREWRAAGEPTGDGHLGGKGLIYGGRGVSALN